MKRTQFLKHGLGLVVLFSILTACTKEPISQPNNTGDHPVPGTETPADPIQKDNYIVPVKAVIAIGTIVYDSIPATLQITSWDSANMQHQTTVNLSAGTNNISLPKAHLKYNLKLTKWGISDERLFTREQISEETVIVLGGTKAAKKLRMEESFLFAEGSYQPEGKAIYTYNNNGNLKQVNYYQKKPQFSDLQATITDVYNYSENQLTGIDHLDENNANTGFTEFIYEQPGKLTHMHQKRYDLETYAYIERGIDMAHDIVSIDYLYGNGNAMEYTMKFKGGNKVEDAALSSTGEGEGGSYEYDTNINPYVHMNMLNMFLSNSSKNNLTGQEKGYGGNVPSAQPYKFEYLYDEDGYPVQLIKSYQSYSTGAHLYSIKTVYTY